MKRIAQQRHLLHLVFVGKTDAEIANSLMKSSSTISERLKKLRNDGLVTQKTRYPSRHEFTAEGEKQFSEFMAVSQNPNAVRLHNISARAEIVRSPENWNELLGSNGFVAFHPRNWRGFKKRFREAAVCVLPDAVIVEVAPTLGEDPQAAFQKAAKIVEDVLSELEASFKGLVLGGLEKRFKLVKPPHIAFLNHPFAEFCDQNRITLSYGSLEVDASVGIPEIEVTRGDTMLQARRLAEFTLAVTEGMFDGAVKEWGEKTRSAETKEIVSQNG